MYLVSEKRAEKREKLEQATRLLDNAEKAGRQLTPTESRRYDNLLAEIDNLQYDIDHADDLVGKQAIMPMPDNRANTGAETWRTAEGQELRSYAPEVLQPVDDSALTSLAKVVRAKIDPRYYDDLNQEERAIGRIGEDATGGYLLPSTLSSNLLLAARNTSPIAALCRQVDLPFGSDVKMAGVDTDATAEFSGEGSTITNSDITWRAITLSPKRLASITKISIELSRAPNALDAIKESLIYAVRNGLELAILSGDGSVAPQGIKNLANVGTSALSAEITVDNIIDAAYTIRAENAPYPIQFIHNADLGKSLQKKKNGDGGYLLTSPGGVPEMWKNIRSYETNVITTTSSATDCFFGNFSQSFLGAVPDNLSILVSPVASDSSSNAMTDGLVFLRVIGWYDWAPNRENWFYYYSDVTV